MTFQIKSKSEREINLKDFANRSVRNTVSKADELCDAVMKHVLEARESWLHDQVDRLNEWLDKTPQTIGTLLKRSPEEIVSLTDAYLTREEKR